VAASSTSTPAPTTALTRSLSTVDAWFFLGASLILIAVAVGFFLK